MAEEPSDKIKGFIKNYDLIQEDCRVDDLLDFSVTIESFKSRIDSIKRPSIVGLVGGFGTGKSTMLYQLEKQIKKDVCWINFDAWKYPERQGLWEGFVLDFADQIGLRDKALKMIQGKGDIDQAIDVVDGAAELASTLVPGAGLVSKIAQYFRSSSATRVFQLQEILSEMIVRRKKRMIIVVEDIDRSRDAGIYFLETLKDFMRRLEPETDIVVIVPIGDEFHHDNMDSYLKCLDYTEYFRPKNVGLEKLVEAVFDNTLFEGKYAYPNSRKIEWTGSHMKGQVTTFLEELFKQPLMTPRLLKNILRHADIVFRQQVKNGHEPDWRVTICMETAKLIPRHESEKESPFDRIRRDRIVQRDTIFGSFLLAMIRDLPSIYKPNQENKPKELVDPALDIEVIDRANQPVSKRPSWPWYTKDYGREVTDRFLLCDFYLDY